jgi:hypothetical protein
LSIEENQLNIISIFPNPTKTELHLDFSKITITVSDIIIYNIQGKAVKTVTRNDDTIQNIKVSNLSKGMYILKMNSVDGKSSTQKLVIN